MIYVPSRLLFLHVPRTAGNAITRSLAPELLRCQSPIIALGYGPVFWRHMTYRDVRPVIDDSLCEVVAVDRPEEEIIASEYAMYRNAGLGPEHTWDRNLKQRLRAAKGGYDQFEEHWRQCLKGESIWEFWTRGATVRRIPYEELDQHWPLLCDLAGCENTPPLMRDDFQLRIWTQHVERTSDE